MSAATFAQIPISGSVPYRAAHQFFDVSQIFGGSAVVPGCLGEAPIIKAG
jgi:hypothetical protein